MYRLARATGEGEESGFPPAIPPSAQRPAWHHFLAAQSHLGGCVLPLSRTQSAYQVLPLTEGTQKLFVYLSMVLAGRLGLDGRHPAAAAS